LHPLAGIGHSLYRSVPGFLSTYSRKLTVGVERKLDPDATITAEYSNVRGIHLPRTRNAAVRLPPDYGEKTPQQWRFPSWEHRRADKRARQNCRIVNEG